MTAVNQLKIVGGGKLLGDEKLRLRLEKYIETHPHHPTSVLGRSDHTGVSRAALDAYLNGTYFIPKDSGGHGVNPHKSQVEEKIRNYLDKVEGVIKDGFTTSFLETRSWMQFQHACKTAIEEKVIVVVYAKPGVGKSRCLQEYKTERMTTMPIDILCSANITTRYFVQKIARAVGVDDRAPTAQLEDLVGEKLKKGIPRPLFVDQANYLNEKALGTICYLWELAKIPIVLIGTKDLYELFTTSRLTQDVRAQLSSRVAMHYPLMELSTAEVKTICKSALGPNATDATVAKIFTVTNGNHRHINMLLPRLNASAKANSDAIESGELSMEVLVEQAASKILV